MFNIKHQEKNYGISVWGNYNIYNNTVLFIDILCLNGKWHRSVSWVLFSYVFLTSNITLMSPNGNAMVHLSGIIEKKKKDIEKMLA